MARVEFFVPTASLPVYLINRPNKIRKKRRYYVHLRSHTTQCLSVPGRWHPVSGSSTQDYAFVTCRGRKSQCVRGAKGGLVVVKRRRI